MNVKIVWGGWSCVAGYVHWAYVCEIEPIAGYAKRAGNYQDQQVSTIGEKIFEPRNRVEINNPKHSDYDKESTEFPKKLCKDWCKDNSHNIVGYIKLRTD